MSHTPGPWENKSGWIVRIYQDEQGQRCTQTIATCNGLPDHDNGSLIAAATELLEAAKLQVLNFTRSEVSGNFLGDDDHEAWTALDKAIAKAEGRS